MIMGQAEQWIPEPWNTARIGRVSVSYRVAMDEPPAGSGVAFSAPLNLGVDMVTAALCRGMYGEDLGELEDPDAVREIVADQIVNGGLFAITDALKHYRVAPADSDAGQLWRACATAVHTAFVASVPALEVA